MTNIFCCFRERFGVNADRKGKIIRVSLKSLFSGKSG